MESLSNFGFELFDYASKTKMGFTAANLIVVHCLPAIAPLSTDVFSNNFVKGLKSTYGIKIANGLSWKAKVFFCVSCKLNQEKRITCPFSPENRSRFSLEMLFVHKQLSPTNVFLF